MRVRSALLSPTDQSNKHVEHIVGTVNLNKSGKQEAGGDLWFQRLPTRPGPTASSYLMNPFGLRDKRPLPQGARVGPVFCANRGIDAPRLRSKRGASCFEQKNRAVLLHVMLRL
ncbi:hypothetical protein MTO96_017061 [Rhipicephalus appendiculatus]